MQVLALDEQQRQAVDESDDVRPPPVEVAFHPQLAHTEKIVIFRCIEIEHPQPLPHPFAPLVAEGDLHAVAQLGVLLPVGGDQGLRGDGGGDLPHGIVVGRIRQAGIQGHQLLAQRAGQHHLAVGRPPQQAVRPEVLVVIGIHRLPAKLSLQILGSCLLDEGVFVIWHSHAVQRISSSFEINAGISSRIMLQIVSSSIPR